MSLNGSDIAVSPIGWVESVFKEKFGTPRQSGVVPSAYGVLHFYAPYDAQEAFEELSGFSHLWVITQFHLIPKEDFRPRVRPPKLGGEKKVGVFASRAPYRPNRLCLSVVKLERIIEEKGKVRLEVSGLDLVQGSPILDVKPYLPYADSIPAATASFGLAREEKIEVIPADDQVFTELSDEEVVLIIEALQAQPQPAYAKENQGFGLFLADLNVRWRLGEGRIIVEQVEKKC